MKSFASYLTSLTLTFLSAFLPSDLHSRRVRRSWNSILRRCCSWSDASLHQHLTIVCTSCSPRDCAQSQRSWLTSKNPYLCGACRCSQNAHHHDGCPSSLFCGETCPSSFSSSPLLSSRSSFLKSQPCRVSSLSTRWRSLVSTCSTWTVWSTASLSVRSFGQDFGPTRGFHRCSMETFGSHNLALHIDIRSTRQSAWRPSTWGSVPRHHTSGRRSLTTSRCAR